MSYWLLVTQCMCMCELPCHSGNENLELSRRVCQRCLFLFWSIIHLVWGLSVCCGFCQWLWVASQYGMGWFSLCPALIFLYSSSSECLVPKCQLPVFTSYCYPWLPRMLKLEWALRRALQVKARVAVSTQWQTGQGQSIEPDNSGKTNEAWFLPIGSGNAGDENSRLPGGSLLAWLRHHCLPPMQRQWQQECPQIDPPSDLCAAHCFDLKVNVNYG